MHIGVVSDTHNNLTNIRNIIKLFNNEKVNCVIHTGDITNESSLESFSDLECNLVGVYGNNDKFEPNLAETAKKNKFDFENPPKVLIYAERKIAIFHEPDPIEDFLKKEKDVDIVLHGHTHRFREERVKNTLIFNPGESAGLFRGKNAIGLINLIDLSVKRVFF